MTDELVVGNFVKLYGSIVRSSVWSESAPTRIVWLTMLAIADADGGVAGSVPGLAHTANVTLAECEDALRVLSEPDPYSKTPDHDGRRIKTVTGGWVVLNYKLYRELRTPKQISDAERQHRKRERDKGVTSVTVTEVTQGARDVSPEVEVEEDVEVTTKSSLSPAREKTKGWPESLTAFVAQRENPGAWMSALVAMQKGLGAPGGKPVTVEHLAQACLEIQQLGGEVTPRRFRRVLEQVTEPKYKAVGGDDAEFVKAANRLQEIASYRDPVRSNSLTTEGWQIVTPQERAAIKAIGTMERVLTAKPDQWPWVVRDFVKAQRGAAA